MIRLDVITVALLASAGTAAADAPTTRCYSGIEHSTVLGSTKDEHVGVRRTLDPANNQLRETVWHIDHATENGKDLVATVDAKLGTFTFEQDGVKGTGTLTGRAWHWTSQTLHLTKNGVELAITSTLDGDHVHMTGSGTKNGRHVVTVTGELDVADCAKLPK